MQAHGEREIGVDGVHANAFASVRASEAGAGEHERGVGGAVCEMWHHCDLPD